MRGAGLRPRCLDGLLCGGLGLLRFQMRLELNRDGLCHQHRHGVADLLILRHTGADRIGGGFAVFYGICGGFAVDF